jgi:hypothetical protein
MSQKIEQVSLLQPLHIPGSGTTERVLNTKATALNGAYELEAGTYEGTPGYFVGWRGRSFFVPSTFVSHVLFAKS